MSHIVITSIHGLTDSIREFSCKGWKVVVVGDKKSKPIASTEGLTYLSPDDQKDLGYAVTDSLPWNHYSRKNIGYLYAMKDGAKVIYETDDDNAPTRAWKMPSLTCNRRLGTLDGKYANVYKLFTEQRPVWPRGYPLDEVLKEERAIIHETIPLLVPVWQGLTNGDGDVDSIYRLTNGEQIEFYGEPLFLQDGTYCPFNSQDTFWFWDAFPMMFLPTTVEFRFTDILRGYIAQPILWASNLHLGFTGPTTTSERNVHDLMADFRDEMRMFSMTKEVVDCIEDAIVDCMMHTNLISVYRALYDKGIVKADDLTALEGWLEDLE